MDKIFSAVFGSSLHGLSQQDDMNVSTRETSLNVPHTGPRRFPKTPRVKRKRLLAIASGGGHWIELMRLTPAFSEFDIVFVSMFDNYNEQVRDHRFYTVTDASRFNLRSFVPVIRRAIRIVLKERPHAIVTTGSAPMLIFILLGRLLGARTLWIDSIANPERMSSSGRIAKLVAHQCVSQWNEVAIVENVECWGAVV